ncbi:MAG TPA: cobalamin B12-binding domain-containing protein [Solirubrobacteraceae bacterium]|nr:cobalamin B12-binding domain-containing protein [Solirubrobacteraceae bacterium]
MPLPEAGNTASVRRALLACAPGDQHTLGLIGFGIGLHQLGWRITYLGADTPTAMLASAAEQIEPDLVSVAISTSGGTPCPDLREQIS